MSKKFMLKSILLLLILSFTITAAAYAPKDKQTVISDNVSAEAKQEANELQRNISLGDNYLIQGKYDDAKQAYEKAISLDKGNKQTYLSIKDKYLGIGRTDDAYYFTELAVQNNVDIKNMNNILAEISGKYDKTIIETYVLVNEKCDLPRHVPEKINNVVRCVPVSWSGVTKIDTSKPCSYTINGDSVQYGRKVEFFITVETIQTSQIKFEESKSGKDVYPNHLKDSKIGFDFYEGEYENLKKAPGFSGIDFVEAGTGHVYLDGLN